MTEREQHGEPRDEHRAELRAVEPPVVEPREQPPRRVVDDTAGVHRLGRGVRWSDIVAMIERDRLASEAARREAA